MKSKKKIYWICQIAGWSTYGLLVHFLLAAVGIGTGDLTEASLSLAQVGFYIVLTHLLRWLIKRRQWFSFKAIKLIPLIFITNILLGVIHYLILSFTSDFIGTSVLSVDLRPLNMIIGVSMPAIMYLLWSALYFSYHFFEEYSKSLKYEMVIRDTELNHLKAQLNPHFIFNALNSIRGLVDEDPNKSKYAITQLSNILRNSLILDKKKLIHFEEELDTVWDYLSLESIRYEERLQVKMDIADDTRHIKIPPMMIQTLVENGIKHGISHLKEGGVIELYSKRKYGKLNIQIRNSGHFDHIHKPEVGVGLANTQKRLDLIYGDEASFRIFNDTNNSVLTEINLPIEN